MSLRITIIGAGLACFSAGRQLADHGNGVTVLEKSRSGGGSCDTKWWECHIVDHGAQNFTIRNPDSPTANAL
jgi:predicted NAD/FAD-dependent oxidoreductase